MNKIQILELKRLIELLVISFIIGLCIGITITLLTVNHISPICKYAKPVYHCNQYIIEPDKCQKIVGGTNTINVN
jgi:hypothetical protein